MPDSTGPTTTTVQDENAEVLAERHPSVSGVAKYLLHVNPNLPGDLAFIAHRFRSITMWLLRHLDDGPELTTALRKLLEAKDCAVRAALP